MQINVCKKTNDQNLVILKLFLQKQMEKETPRTYWSIKQRHIDCYPVAGYSVQFKNESVFDQLP